MENLESNVRKECKQAFAELQTSVEAATADDSSGFSTFFLFFIFLRYSLLGRNVRTYNFFWRNFPGVVTQKSV